MIGGNVPFSRLVDLRNATHYYSSAASGTIITAGANTNGILLRFAYLEARSNSGSASSILLFGGTNMIMNYAYGAAGTYQANMSYPFGLVLPSGSALTFTTSGAGASLSVWYELL